MRFLSLQKLLLVLLPMLLFASCGKEDDSKRIEQEMKRLDGELLLYPEISQDLPPEVPEEKTPRVVDSAIMRKEDYPFLDRDGYYIISEEHVRAVRHHKTSKFSGYFSSALVYPGNLVNVRRAIGGDVVDAPVLQEYRAPGELFLPVVNGATGNSSVVLTDYAPSAVNERINQLVSEHKGGLAANIQFNTKALYSREDLLRLVGMEADNPLIRPLLDKPNWDAKTKKVAVYYTQCYFSLCYSPSAAGAKGFFKPRTSQESVISHLSKFKKDGLAYIFEVNYGRTFILLFEERPNARYLNMQDAETDIQNLQEALDRKERVKADSLAMRIATCMDVYALQLGGKGQTPIIGGVAGLPQFYNGLVQTANYTKGDGVVPFSYSLRRMDNGEFISYKNVEQEDYIRTIYARKSVGTKMTFEFKTLKSKGVDGPVDGNYEYVSHDSYFLFKGFIVKKYVGGILQESVKLYGQKRVNGKGAFSSRERKSHTFDGLDPMAEDIEFELSFEADLHGVRYSNGVLGVGGSHSDGRTHTYTRRVRIAFNRDTRSWVFRDGNSDNTNWRQSLRLFETSDYCQFDISVGYNFKFN